MTPGEAAQPFDEILAALAEVKRLMARASDRLPARAEALDFAAADLQPILGQVMHLRRTAILEAAEEAYARPARVLDLREHRRPSLRLVPGGVA